MVAATEPVVGDEARPVVETTWVPLDSDSEPEEALGFAAVSADVVVPAGVGLIDKVELKPVQQGI